MTGLEMLGGFGAPVVAVLVFLSFVALTVTLFKVFQFQRLGVGSYRTAERAMGLWASGDRMSALQTAAGGRSQICQVLALAMDTLTRDPTARMQARQRASTAAIGMLTHNARQLRIIETIVQAAPMLGLLGTVIGMIEAFQQISASNGAADPASLAGGIWIALITTALGLGVAIPFYFVSVWLDSRLDQERATFESAISSLTAS